MLGRVCGVLVVRLGACPRLSGRGFGGSVWCGGCVSCPLFRLGCVVPRPPWLGSVGGVSPCRPLCPPPSVSFPCRFGRCFPGAVLGPSRLWWVGGGPCRRLGSLPLVFPRGGADVCTPRQGVTLLYGPSIGTRSVQTDLLRSQVLKPFPTPGSGTLWVAGESLQERRVSCLLRWTVCPTRSPSLGPNRSTCRGECSWSGPLVTPPGRCHRGPLTNGPGRIPPYCVCSGGADTVTGGAPKPLRLGPSPASPVGPFRPAPNFAVWFAVVSRLSGVGWWWGGGGGFAVPGRVAPVRVASSSGCGSPSVCLFVAQCVRAWCLVCGAWFVVCGVRLWCVGGVVAGVWCVWSLATPGGGSCVLLPATPGWVSLPVVVCGSPPLLAGVSLPAVVCGVWCVVCGMWGAAVVCWWGCGWCVVWLVPRHSLRRLLCATPRHSWSGFAAGGGGRSSPLLAGVPGRRWCVVGFRLVCGVVGPSPLLAEVPVCYSPPLLVGFRCRWWWAVLATPG